jgi:hypothetical protein
MGCNVCVAGGQRGLRGVGGAGWAGGEGSEVVADDPRLIQFAICLADRFIRSLRGQKRGGCRGSATSAEGRRQPFAWKSLRDRRAGSGHPDNGERGFTTTASPS